MNLSIDASNLLLGGGIKHLRFLLQNIEHSKFEKIIVYGPAKLLAVLPESSKVDLREIPEKTSSIVYRGWWQVTKLSEYVRLEGGVLFVPGGAYLGNYRPFVTMFRNMQVFETVELNREGLSKEWLRLKILQTVQAKTFQNSSGLICLSEYAQSHLQQFYPNLLKTVELRRIPHGISQLEENCRDYVLKSPIQLLYVSTVKQYKHQWNLIDAVAQLKRQGYSIELHLVGAGDTSALRKMQEAIDRHDDLEAFVHYHDGLPYTEIFDWYQRADLFAYPSSCENLPNILLEAMSSALPIACSDRGPMPEVLRDAGCYFNPEQPKSIAASLKMLLDDKTLRQRLGRKALEYSQKYTWERCAQETFSFLQSVHQRHCS